MQIIAVLFYFSGQTIECFQNVFVNHFTLPCLIAKLIFRDEIKSQEETAEQAAPIGNISQTVITQQGTDDSEAVAQPAGDQANTETIIQPGPAEQEAPKQVCQDRLS